jgi:hypothetical protein
LFSLRLERHKAAMTLVDRRTASYELTVDGIPQSIVSKNDPTILDYPYIRYIARALDAAAPAGSPVLAVHLGAGALTLARYVEATRAGSPQLVVEFEPALYRAVVTALPLAQGNGVRAIFGDARAVADMPLPTAFSSRDAHRAGVDCPAVDTDWIGADFTVVDLWDAAVIHRRVASREFYLRVAARSGVNGIVAVNVLDGHPFEYARRQAATLASVFDHVAVVLDADPNDADGPLDNVLVFASNHPLTMVGHPELLGSPRPYVVHGEALRRWIGMARVLTDADGIDSPDPDDPRWD